MLVLCFVNSIHKECGDDHSIKLEIEVLIAKLSPALERKFNLFWQIKFLERYVTEGINPQGLSIQVFPNLWETNNEFKAQWEANLQDCMSKMMTSLIEHYDNDIKDLDIEIIEFQKQLLKRIFREIQ